MPAPSSRARGAPDPLVACLSGRSRGQSCRWFIRTAPPIPSPLQRLDTGEAPLLRRKRQLARDHILVAEPAIRHTSGGQAAMGSGVAFLPGGKPLHRAKNVDRAARAREAENVLPQDPPRLSGDRPPLLFRSAPCRFECSKGQIAAGKVFIGVVDPEVDVVREHWLVSEQKVHSADQQIVHTAITEGA